MTYSSRLDRFNRENRNVGSTPSRIFARHLFAPEEEARHAQLGKRELEAAMRRLFKNKKVANAPYGKTSNQHYRLVRA
jgi:hypothetical protein